MKMRYVLQFKYKNHNCVKILNEKCLFSKDLSDIDKNIFCGEYSMKYRPVEIILASF